MEHQYSTVFDDAETAIAEIRRLKLLGYEPTVRISARLDVDELMDHAVEGIEQEQTESISPSDSDSQSDSSDEGMDDTRDENKTREERSEESERNAGVDGRRGAKHPNWARYVGHDQRKRQAVDFFRRHPNEWVTWEDFADDVALDLKDDQTELNVASSALKNAYRREYLPDIETKYIGRTKMYRYHPDGFDEPEDESKSDEGEEETPDEEEEEEITFHPQTKQHRVLTVMYALDDGDGTTSVDVIECVPYTDQQVYNAIRSLEDRGMLRRMGSSRPYTYYLTPFGESVIEEVGGYQINVGDDE